jgi:hypothetical protein
MLERRENDKIILDRLESIQKDVTKTQIDLALNTQATTQLAEYQKFQNGRLGTIESRTQAVEGAQAITSVAVAAIKAAEEKKQAANEKKDEKIEDARKARYDKLFWLVLGLLITFLGNLALFLIRSDILKEIFK